MKFLPLIWAGLARKPTRLAFTVLSLVAAFLLFGILQGLSAGFDATLDPAQVSFGRGDILLQ